MQIFDIFLLEAIINGILLGGVLALLALGLNLIFGVIDVVWIAYAELVMCGMYTIYWLTRVFGTSWHAILLASLVAIVFVAILGILVHQLIISPLLDTPPINQFLATGGLLFLLQSFATLLFGADFRNLGLHLPILNIFEMYISFSRLLAFVTAIVGMIGLYLFLTRTYIGTAIRAVAQDREVMVLMGVDTKKLYLITSAIGGGLAGLAALLLSLQYDVHPFIGLTFGPITFMICVLGGLGNMLGGSIAAFIMSQFISIGGLYFSIEISYVSAFVFFIIMMFLRPEGIMRRG
jgi:branched-chain amino acid transport system permease protein